MNVLIYNEYFHERQQEEARAVYPDGLHTAIAGAVAAGDVSTRFLFLEDVEKGLPDNAFDDTDVLFWWGHMAHHRVPDSVAEQVAAAVNKGMGLIALHSAHLSKPFRRLMGTSCTLRWRQGDRERVWVSAPRHPIARGIPEQFELPVEEMYGEFFDIPKPDDVVFLGWFSGGELFRSGVTFTRGYGRVFYFQPGHETCPTYHDPNVRRILNNALRWAAPEVKRESLDCPMVPAPEDAR